METMRLLVVEDDPDDLKMLKEGLEIYFDAPLAVAEESDFQNAMDRLDGERFDLVVLDVHRGDPTAPAIADELEEGRRLFEEIRKRQFIPIIFHTGLPQRVRDLESELVRIVPKGERADDLSIAVKAMTNSGLARLSRAMHRHVDEVQRFYMWEFVAKHWEQMDGNGVGTKGGDVGTVAHLLARRLALSFDGAGADKIAAALAPSDLVPAATAEADRLHPVRMYVMPPLHPTRHRAGDVYREAAPAEGYLVLLTPSCYLVAEGARSPKVDNVVLARCSSLLDRKEYAEWATAESNTKRRELLKLLKNADDRRYYLPAALDLPHLLVDFGSLQVVPFEKLASMTHIASLDAPFAASMLASFQRYYGQYGTPGLELEAMLDRMKAELGRQKAAAGSVGS